MKYIISTNTNAAYNLAVEEYLLKNKSENFFLLYKNNDSIIVGKHQNTLAEINFEKLKELNISVVRRLSGGGTVFHDLGNLNYCIILSKQDRNLIEFKKHSSPIIEVLQELGVNAKFEGRSDLTIDGMKFSGNACHIFRNKVMQHGTLLFNSDLGRLNGLLKVNPLKFKDKGIRSIRSKVTNIKDHLTTDISIDDFAKLILAKVASQNENQEEYTLTKEDNLEIEKLINEKYTTWEWNYAYSPKYKLEKFVKTKQGGILETVLSIKKGIIIEMELYGSGIISGQSEKLCALFINSEHNKSSSISILEKININDYIKDIDNNEFLDSIF